MKVHIGFAEVLETPLVKGNAESLQSPLLSHDNPPYGFCGSNLRLKPQKKNHHRCKTATVAA